MSSGTRKWVGNLFLRAPASVRSIRNVPVLGGLVHRLSHRVLSSEQRIWAQVEAGPAKGIWMELNPRTGQNYLRGDAEPLVQEALAQRLRPGMVFYDLGANIGLFSLLSSRLVGPAGRVFSFEPDAETVIHLERNVERAAFQNVTIIAKGVWSMTGRQWFARADTSSPDRGTGTFLGSGKLNRSISVECVALDDFVQGAPPPNAIKCDVEGAELQVLRGAQQTIRAHRPVIVCEMHTDANGRACREMLREFGYNLIDVDSSHLLAIPYGS